MRLAIIILRLITLRLVNQKKFVTKETLGYRYLLKEIDIAFYNELSNYLAKSNIGRDGIAMLDRLGLKEAQF